MTSPPDEVIQKVREWASIADQDLQLAEHAMTMASPPHALVAYHAQQCAEKYLKGFLVFKGVDFPYTHNIGTLLELCEKHGNWTAPLADADELSRFAAMARYPGIGMSVSETEGASAVETARRVRQIVRKALGELGLRIP
jgi:HEPN domain-containing protein